MTFQVGSDSYISITVSSTKGKKKLFIISSSKGDGAWWELWWYKRKARELTVLDCLFVVIKKHDRQDVEIGKWKESK